MSSLPASLASKLLYGKACVVQAGDILITTGQLQGLDVEFEVRRGVKVTHGVRKPQPNTCDLIIYNLSETHRNALAQATTPAPGAKAKVVPTIISAGYLGRSSVIFSGELRAANSKKDGPTWVTRMTTGDGDQALTQQRLTIALGPGATATQAMKAIVAALGIGEGNLTRALALLSANPLAASLFAKGVAFKGPAADILTDLCRATGLDWSIQNGALQVTGLNQPLQGQSILLDSDHGLLDSPTVDTNGILSCRTEMIPDIFPGVVVSMNALAVKGGYRVLNVKTRGSTMTSDWGHWIEAVRY